MEGCFKLNFQLVSIVFLGFLSPFSDGQILVKHSYTVTAQFQNQSLVEVLTQLVKDQKIPLSFDPESIPFKKIQMNCMEMPIKQVLDSILGGTHIESISMNGEIILRLQVQEMLTLSGHIRDQESGEDLIGADLEWDNSPIRVITNTYGYYVITLPQKTGILIIHHLGYFTKRISITKGNSLKDGTLDIFLNRAQETLKEVNIKTDSNRSFSGYSVLHGNALSLNLFTKLPYYGGERDIIKALQMQNGIIGLSEGSGSLFIRGGNKDQNLFMLDEATVYNPGHLFGLVSIFNPDAVKNIQIFDDRIPASYGGRLSSVVDARTTDGDKEAFHFRGGISFLSSRLSLEGPLTHPHRPENGNSFFLGLRFGELNSLNNTLQLLNIKALYFDVNLKVNFRLNPRNQIFISGYNGIDNLLSRNANRNIWGNQTGTFRLNHVFGARLFLNISAIYSHYQNLLDVNYLDSLISPKWKTSIQDISLKGDFTYYYKTNNQFKFGFNKIFHSLIPGELQNTPSTYNIPREYAEENAIYASHISHLFGPTQISYGIRASWFQNTSSKIVSLDPIQGGGTGTTITSLAHTYFNLEPRVDFIYKPNAVSQFHLSFDRTVQYLQILENDELAFSSLETWFPSGAKIKPQVGNMESFGFQTASSHYLFQVDIYDKQLFRQLDLLDHTQIILNPSIASQLRSGNSQAYGIELSLQKISGKLIGNLGYTYSRVFRTITDINHNQNYPANYDIPHSIKFTLSYRFSPRISLTSFFIYSSGRPITLPVGFYYQENLRVPIFDGRNSSRFPDIHRLDINLSIEPRKIKRLGKSFMSTWTLGIYNVYNKKNPLYFGVNQNATVGSLGYLRYFSGIAPNVSYSFKF